MRSHRPFSVSPVIRYENPEGPFPVSFRTIPELLDESMSSTCGENSSYSKLSDSPVRKRESRRSKRIDKRLSGCDVPALLRSCFSITLNVEVAQSVSL